MVMQHTRHAKADEANAVIGYFGYDKTHTALMIFSGFHSTNIIVTASVHEPSFQISMQSSETVSFLQTPVPGSRVVRIGPLCFVAGYHKRRLNQGRVVSFVLARERFFVFQVHVLLCFYLVSLNSL